MRLVALIGVRTLKSTPSANSMMLSVPHAAKAFVIAIESSAVPFDAAYVDVTLHTLRPSEIIVDGYVIMVSPLFQEHHPRRRARQLEQVVRSRCDRLISCFREVVKRSCSVEGKFSVVLNAVGNLL